MQRILERSCKEVVIVLFPPRLATLRSNPSRREAVEYAARFLAAAPFPNVEKTG